MLMFFLVSRSHPLNIIAGGGIRLNFLRSPKAKDATVPRSQKNKYCRIYFGQENALWDR